MSSSGAQPSPTLAGKEPSNPSWRRCGSTCTRTRTPPPQGGTFGYRLGRNTLVTLLNSQREIGINHVSINLLGSTRRAGEQIEEIAEHVLPKVTG